MNRAFCLSLFVLSLFGCRGSLGALDDTTLNRPISTGQFLKGHVASAGSPKRFTHFRYDLLGRPLSTQHVVEGSVFSYGNEFGYSGGPAQGSELGTTPSLMIFPDGERVVSLLDAAGSTQELAAQMPATLDATRLVYRDRISGRTKLNRYAQVEWTEAGDNTRTLRTYDAFRRPLHVMTQKSATGEILQAFGYRYDKVGRVSQIRDYCAQTANGIVCCDPRQSSCTEGPLSATYEYE